MGNMLPWTEDSYDEYTHEDVDLMSDDSDEKEIDSMNDADIDGSNDDDEEMDGQLNSVDELLQRGYVSKLKLHGMGCRGIGNLGNTCYMNSTVQALSNIPELRDFFITSSYKKELNSKSSKKGILTKEFAGLLKQLWAPTSQGNRGPAVATKFKKAVSTCIPRFRGYRQHDSQELLRFLLDVMHEDLNRIAVKPKWKELKDIEGESVRHQSERWWKNHHEWDDSFIQDLFLGQLKNVLSCSYCKHSSTAFDPFMDLSVPIPQSKSSSRWNSDDSPCELKDCLDLFLKEESLSGLEQVYCSKCKKHRDMKKKFSLFRLPKVLVIHFSRFSKSRRKLCNDIDFPLTLQLDNYLDKEAIVPFKPTYQLVSVVNHSGSVNFGHYTAYGKHDQTQQWHNFNDSSVSSTSANHIGGPRAYILFYVLK